MRWKAFFILCQTSLCLCVSKISLEKSEDIITDSVAMFCTCNNKLSITSYVEINWVSIVVNCGQNDYVIVKLPCFYDMYLSNYVDEWNWEWSALSLCVNLSKTNNVVAINGLSIFTDWTEYSLSFCRSEVYRYSPSLLLPVEHIRLSHLAHGWGSWPHVCWQQRLHSVPGPPRHQPRTSHSKNQHESLHLPPT